MRRYVVVVALLMVVAGCGEEKPNAPTAPVSHTVSPTPTPSVAPKPTPPVMPEVAKADTKAGARAFVRIYLGILNEAQATGNLASAKAVETPMCGSCRRFEAKVDRVYRSGGTIRGGRLRFDWVTVGRRPDLQAWVVSGIAIAGPQTVMTPGQGTTHLQGVRGPLNFFVIRRDGEFRVLDWTRSS